MKKLLILIILALILGLAIQQRKIASLKEYVYLLESNLKSRCKHPKTLPHAGVILGYPYQKKSEVKK